jgi:UDP-2,3-diacylglucosamine hydrolase
VPVYFASDMHLRLDKPDRGRRLAEWVDRLAPGDFLYLVGDVCDFWYATRQRRRDPMACEGLHALARFRSRGGELVILPGNHDLWLGPFYEQTLGARFVSEPVVVDAYGKLIHVVHGHRTGGRQPWKAGMESHAFFRAFEQLPGPIARKLDILLNQSNDRGRAQDEARLIAVFRRSLDSLEPSIDLAVFGHVHSPLDDPTSRPRLVILGGWHSQSSYLRVDDAGATLVVDPGAPSTAMANAPAGMTDRS